MSSSEFAGKTGFGSEDYHGKPDEVSSGKRVSTGSIELVKQGASQFATQFAGQAHEDFETVKRIVATGGSKLGEMLADIQVFSWFYRRAVLSRLFGLYLV